LKKKFLIGGIFLVSAIAVTAITYFTIKKITKKDLSKGRFLFIGDSTTANSNGYVEKIRAKFPNAIIKKIAKVGEKTDWMLDQLKKELSTGVKYDVISILGGSNDIFSTLRIDNAKSNLDEMYSLAKKNGAKVIAITPPSKLFFPSTNDKHRQLISDFNKWIKSNKKVDIFIDLENLVNKKELFASDFQHINNKGHEILAQDYIKNLS
jgi:lysophospholipase L1-like esterase